MILGRLIPAGTGFNYHKPLKNISLNSGKILTTKLPVMKDSILDRRLAEKREKRNQ